VDCNAAPISFFSFPEIPLGIQAADRDAAAVEGAQAFENFDRGGFTGAIGAQQTEDFAFFYGETYAADGFDRRRSA